MSALRYTLVTEGSSDRVLMPILDWLLIELLGDLGNQIAIDGKYADLASIKTRDLSEKIAQALDLYPCDLLFIHRAADSKPPQDRVQEILQALARLPPEGVPPSPVPIIPVRMTEAWLLISETAIRVAACHRDGKARVQLPPLHSPEKLADPKQKLFQLLLQASELSGRRRRDFNPRKRIHQISLAISDFTPLRQLSSFQNLEKDLRDWMRVKYNLQGFMANA